MLRVECTGCGQNVRANDDWSGRTANCPQCGAVILFPNLESEFDRAEIAAQEAAPTLVSRVAVLFSFPNLGRLKIVAMLAAIAVSLLFWSRFIIVLAYGLRAYTEYGLRVVGLKKHHVLLNNGHELNWFWDSIFTFGVVTTWYLLMELADRMLDRIEQKVLAWSLILLAGGVSWYSLLHKDQYEARRVGLVTNDWSSRVFMVALLAMVGYAAYRFWAMRREIGEGEELSELPEAERGRRVEGE